MRSKVPFRRRNTSSFTLVPRIIHNSSCWRLPVRKSLLCNNLTTYLEALSFTQSRCKKPPWSHKLYTAAVTSSAPGLRHPSLLIGWRGKRVGIPLIKTCSAQHVSGDAADGHEQNITTEDSTRRKEGKIDLLFFTFMWDIYIISSSSVLLLHHHHCHCYSTFGCSTCALV